MRLLLQTLKAWIPLAVAVTLLSGVIYVTAQQVIRLGANEPQIQMAQDAAAALAAQTPLEDIVPLGQVDVAHSLAPFLIVFDQDRKVLAANAVLHGAVPNLPAGVLDDARQQGEGRISWQPEPGVREAAVVVPVAGGSGGYVLAGRSLREAETRIGVIGKLVTAGWAGTLVATLLAALVVAALPIRTT